MSTSPALKTILVVEDDSGNGTFLEMAIQSETPYQAMLVASESEMLRRIEEIKALKPALFLLDYRLPRTTATKLYDQLHAIEGLEEVPAIIITAETPELIEPEIRQRNLLLLPKPFELDNLLETIKNIVN